MKNKLTCHLFIASLLCGALIQAGCSGNTATPANNSSQTTARSNSARTADAPGGGGSSSSPAGVTSTHGTQAPSGDVEKDRALLDTATLDAKIASALPKAKAANASAADKKAAADAYLARGNAYRDAGNPSLYKFALADYNSVLIFDPANAEAKSKKDEIVGIYQGMGRPIPQVSNEK